MSNEVTFGQNEHLPIQSWAEADRPREKLLKLGRSNLTDAELIAILIGSGTQRLTAVDLSKHILAKVDNDLNRLAQLTVNDLKKFKGIGEAKAISIVAALELGRRRQPAAATKHPRVDGPQAVYEAFKPYLLDLPHEEFWVMLLSSAQQVLAVRPVGRGGERAVIADTKLVFSMALEEKASSVILCHNHPSGMLVPSSQDIALTKRFVAAGKALEIVVADHIIFANRGYFSFLEKNML